MDNDFCLQQPVIIIFSAADEAGVKRTTDVYQQYFNRLPQMTKKNEAKYLVNLAYTLSSRRSSLPWKAFFIAQTINQARVGLTTSLSNPTRSSYRPKISYIFTGQGAQHATMARGLSVYPVFSESVRKSQEYLRSCGCEWVLMGTSSLPVVVSANNYR